MGDAFPFAELFAAADGVNRHPWSPQKPTGSKRAASTSTAVAARDTAQRTILHAAPRPGVTEAEILRIDCGKDRFAYVYRVASTPSGKIKDGSEVQLVANRDLHVARRCHRIFFAGDVVPGQKLHKLGKGDPAYIGKLQADATQNVLTICGRKEAAPARARENSGEDKHDAAATPDFKRRGASAVPSTDLKDTRLPRLVEFGIIVRSPTTGVMPVSDPDSTAAASGTEDEGRTRASRVRAIFPHLDKHGHMRPHISFDFSESMWAGFQKGFAHRFVELECRDDCIDNLDEIPTRARPAETHKAMAVIDAATAAKFVEALRDTARGLELRVSQHQRRPPRHLDSKTTDSAKQSPSLGRARPTPEFKVWEAGSNMLSVEFTAPLTSFQVFAVVLGVMV